MTAASQNTDRGQAELQGYVTVLRRRKGIILLTTALVVGVSVALSLVQKPEYKASAEVLLQSRASEQILSLNQQQASQVQQDEVQTEIRVMQSRSVRGAVAKKLGYNPAVSISGDQTHVVTISSQNASPTRAAREANTYAETFVDVRRDSLVKDLLAGADQIRQQIAGIDQAIAALDEPVNALNNQITASDDPAERQRLTNLRDQMVTDNSSKRASLNSRRGTASDQLDKLQLSANVTQTGGAQIVSEAATPTSPVGPTPKRDAVLSLILGLVLGGALAFLIEYLDDSVRTKDDFDRATGGLEVLGLVPQVDTWRDRRAPTLVSISAPRSPASEAYRGLRTSLQFIGVERTLKLVQITSPSVSEGKTTTLANLGVALARAGQRVVLVDCDLRRPRLHQFMGVSNDVGLTSAILGEVTMEQALIAVPDQPRLALLPSGPPPPNPSEVLSSNITRELIKSLADIADYVLIDTPPLLPVADAVVVAGIADAVILVATARSTTKRATRRAIELLRQVDAPLIGAVLNGVGAEATYAYGYGGYEYSYTHAREPLRTMFRRSRDLGSNGSSAKQSPPSERESTGGTVR